MEENKMTVDLYENKDQLLNASIDKITVEIIKKRKNKKTAQTIVMTGCSPLAGTTSVAISLAIAMAATDRSTLLIDCDVRKAVKYKKLNDHARSGLANYISKLDESVNRPDEIIYETNIDNLKYIPCGDSNENPTRILCSERVGSLIDGLKKDFDCIILDCPSYSVVPDAEVLFNQADGIILVAALGETKKAQIKDGRRLIKPFSDIYYGMIINKCSKKQYKASIKEYDYYLLDKNGKQHFEKNKAYIKRNALCNDILREEKLYEEQDVD